MNGIYQLRDVDAAVRDRRNKWQRDAREKLLAGRAALQAIQQESARVPEPVAIQVQAIEQPKPLLSGSKKQTLSTAQMFKLCEWVKATVPNGTRITQGHLAEQASKAVGFPVGVSNVSTALEATGVTLIRGGFTQPNKSTGDRVRSVAKALRDLMVSLGYQVPEDINDIASGKSIS